MIRDFDLALDAVRSQHSDYEEQRDAATSCLDGDGEWVDWCPMPATPIEDLYCDIGGEG